MNQEYKEKLIQKVSVRVFTKFFLPSWARAIYTTLQAVKYVAKGIRCLAKGKLEVEVLDATAVTVSIARLDFNTAGSIMFLLGVGELLEEWTHKKSVGDLARSMSLHIEKVWLYAEGQEVLVPISTRSGKETWVSARVGSVDPSGRNRRRWRSYGKPGFHDRGVHSGQEGKRGLMCMQVPQWKKALC